VTWWRRNVKMFDLITMKRLWVRFSVRSLLCGWATVCSQKNNLGIKSATQFTSAWPSLQGRCKCNEYTSQSCDVNRHTARCTSPYPWSRSVNWCLAETYELYWLGKDFSLCVLSLCKILQRFVLLCLVAHRPNFGNSYQTVVPNLAQIDVVLFLTRARKIYLKRFSLIRFQMMISLLEYIIIIVPLSLRLRMVINL